jgi:carboxymethylenebutenolidase
VASYGARDRPVGDAPARLKRILDGHGTGNDVQACPGAGHSFMNNHPGTLATFTGAAGTDAAPPRVFTVISLLTGPLTAMGYDQQATGDARAPIAAFFDAHLRPPAP